MHVLVLYTGGTIGSRRREPEPDSPQVVVSWEELEAATPELDRLRQRGLVIDIVSPIEPTHSCNMGPEQWVRIAETIGDNYEDYEGFVILHGTDTMVYTASALSFMLRNLGKPVVLTGAQRSAMVDVRNDAIQNLITAVHIACPSYSQITVIPEVCIYFGGKLLRGNRAIKRDTAGYDAYESPNLPPLGEVGDRIVIDTNLIRPVPPASRRFHIHTHLDPNVTTVFVYPGIQNGNLAERQLLQDERLRAAVVLSYGTGNIPTNDRAFLDAFEQANRKGVLLVNASQCRRGPVKLGQYETSARLVEMGFIAAHDITVEAALCKLQVLLADPDLNPREVREIFQRNVAGEQSTSMYLTKFPVEAGRINCCDAPAASVRIPGRPLEGKWDPARLESALLRFHKASIGHSRSGLVQFRLFAELDSPEQASEKHPGYAGKVHKEAGGETGLVVFDLTHAVASLGSPGERMSFTLFVDTPGAEFTWSEVDLALVVREAGH
jgi:L-asparaginase